MRKSVSGFSIVEVTVVVAILAILVAVSIVAYNRVQIDTRDSERSSKAAILIDALEKYYEKHGEYPSCSSMTEDGSIVGSEVLGGVEADVFLVPGSPEGTTNSIICTALTANGPDAFAYVGDGSAACTSGLSCLKYTLQFRDEDTGTITSIESKHQADISNTTTPIVTATAVSTTQIDLSWTEIDNAISYTIYRATNSSFSINRVDTVVGAGTSAQITGLSPGTTYYFAVSAQAEGSTTQWSPGVSATTSIDAPTSAPVITAALSGTNAQASLSNSITCAAGTTAELQFQSRQTATATNGSWSSWSAWQAASTYSVAGLQGYSHGFQAQARCTGPSASSSVTATSNIASVVRPISTPAAPVYLTPSQFNGNGTPANVTYSSSCPSGTTRINATFRSLDWTGGNHGPYNWGFSDWWTNSSTTTNRTVSYWGKYRCQTTHSTSSYSPESFNNITVTHT